MAKEPVILSHWGRLIDGLQASPLDFFGSVEQAIVRRALPDTERSRIDYFEGGAFSAKREYLRVRRQRFVFDVSGAPFGTGFFVSWWFGELRAGPWMLMGVVGVLLFLLWLAFKVGFVIGILFFLFGLPLILVYLARRPPVDLAGWDDPILSLPVVGAIYQGWFKPETRYKVDIAMAFQQAVHSAVLEVVDGLAETGGLRALSDIERQPVLREFLRR